MDVCELHEFCASVDVSRGLAVVDLDDDGDLDVVVTNANGRARVFENRLDKLGSWLRVRAFDSATKSLGAKSSPGGATRNTVGTPGEMNACPPSSW